MAKQICPSCGAVYNGKKCRNCLYQPMTAAPSPQTSKPTARPSGRKRRSSPLRSLIGFLILLILIGLMLPILQNWGQDLKATAEARAVPLFPATSSAVP